MTTIMHTEAIASMRLWQLISPALPVGAYAYSSGLESAIQQELVQDEIQALEWIRGVLLTSLTHLDLPVLKRLYDAWNEDDASGVQYWNQFLQASRESRELLAEDRHLGNALARLLVDLDISDAQVWKARANSSYATLFSLAAVRWDIPLQDAAQGYLWSWCENQIAAAIKLIPLGQTAGQRLLTQLLGAIPEYVETGLQLEDDEIGMASPMIGIVSAYHETQYSRLFRS